MQPYSFILVTRQRSNASYHEAHCRSDMDATRFADRLRGGRLSHCVEIWNGDRFVAVRASSEDAAAGD